jgi:hypothetical protein
MSEIQNEALAKTCQEIEKLQLENAELSEKLLELTDELLSYTGLPGQMHRIDCQD